jgi:hypothetical protein
MVVAVPWESVNGTFAREVDEALRRQGVTASVVRGNSLSLSDLRDAIEAVRSPRIDLDGSAEEVDAPRPRPEVWLLALPRQAIGKGPGLMPPRRVPALPSATGVPVLVARHGRLPRTILALIDGAEGADKAGTLACELARHTGARLSLLVPRIEGESESLEQATFIEGYARSIGLGGIEVHYADEVNPAAIERRLVGKADLIVAPSIPRALRGRDLARLASEGDTSVLLV